MGKPRCGRSRDGKTTIRSRVIPDRVRERYIVPEEPFPAFRRSRTQDDDADNRRPEDRAVRNPDQPQATRDGAKATGAGSTVAMLTASDPNDRQSALLSGTPHPEGGDNPQIA
jgi:hypothetical protein